MSRNNNNIQGVAPRPLARLDPNAVMPPRTDKRDKRNNRDKRSHDFVIYADEEELGSPAKKLHAHKAHAKENVPPTNEPRHRPQRAAPGPRRILGELSISEFPGYITTPTDSRSQLLSAWAPMDDIRRDLRMATITSVPPYATQRRNRVVDLAVIDELAIKRATDIRCTSSPFDIYCSPSRTRHVSFDGKENVAP